MFARQIAVMKGQAWNVVETLKTADHGPLELTRRAKVCVWDDLVDVPIAVPMRVPSAEMRRRADPTDHVHFRSDPIEEEMDIGAVNSSSAGPPDGEDLLGMAPSPPADLPHPGRFELSRSSTDQGADNEAGVSSADQSSASPTRERKSDPLGQDERPRLPRTAIGASFHGPARALNMYSPARQHERRYSFATAASRRNSNSIAQQLYGGGGGQSSRHELYDEDDDLEGDLGYTAAEGMEGNQRKVIVERLEPVKSKNPVFTWC